MAVTPYTGFRSPHFKHRKDDKWRVIHLVPAFVGLGAPYWESRARGAIIGMNRGTNKSHVIRAALESIAYQVRDAVELLEAESGIPLREFRADGGASANAFLMQFQADLLSRTVMKSEVEELSALGSTYMGGLAVELWSSTDEIAAQIKSYQSNVSLGYTNLIFT